MTSEAIRSKEINETGINKNETSRFDQDVQEKPHDDDMENKSSSIPERTTKPLEKSQHSSIPFSNRTNKSRLEEACTKTMNERYLAVLLNELPLKEKDPTSFTIPCQVLKKQKEAENLAADHSSRLENPHMKVLTEREIADKFSDEHLMVLNSKFKDDEPWYADFINYIVGKVVPLNWTFEKRKRFFSQFKTYFWEEPYAFKLCAENIMRRCVAGSETLEILAHYNSGPTGNISSRNEMPQSNIQIYSMAGSDDKIPPPPPQTPTPTQQAPHTVSTIKLPILKKDEYDIWAMKMEHYLSHIDYPIWEVIQKGNGPFEGFYVSNSEGLHKGYDMFQSLLSKLEIHGASVSTEDVNQKFLRSLPSSWSQVSLVMRTKPGVDNLSIDNLYNNLRVFESDIKGSTRSSSIAKNVAFVSSESTSSTNDVSTANRVSTSFGYNSQRENSSSYTDEIMYSFFANQSSGPHLDHEDLELDEFDLEEIDLKWQVAMISMRLKKFYKKIGRKLHFNAKEPVGFDKTKSNGRRPGKQEEPKALVTLDGEGVDWTDHAKDEQENFALMAYNNSGQH
ncbi:hypothetical protein Tco_0431865 [Tanacetum coccineum]